MTSTVLKLVALALMLVDHIGEFIPGTPVWLHWLGRISAPLFMFCMVWGFHYTHDRKKYLLRMYLFGVAMGVMDLICNNLVQKPYCYITNNIFVTLLSIALICGLIDIWRKDKKKGRKYIGIYILFQFISTAICILFGTLVPIRGASMFAGAVTANLIFNEGSFVFAFLGVLMYVYKENKKKLAIAYSIYCIVYFIFMAVGASVHEILYNNYQWMMIASLPFMCLYNGKKGSGLKYLFYVFYPVHILILFLIGNYCF